MANGSEMGVHGLKQSLLGTDYTIWWGGGGVQKRAQSNQAKMIVCTAVNYLDNVWESKKVYIFAKD